MPHPHRGAGHGHSHPDVDSDGTGLLAALLLILAFMAVEVVAGALVHSLALLSDAAHMLTDAAALGLALVALRLAARPPEGGFTYGLKRAEILSAMANGVTLAVLAVWIVAEAVQRLISPPEVGGRTMLAVGATGIAVNLLATWRLTRSPSRSLNVEATVRHVLTDLYAFAGTVVAGVVVLTTGVERADPIAALVVAGLMLWAAAGLIRDAGRSLLEAAPAGLDPEVIGAALAAHPHVSNVHDLHVWEITSGFTALSAHVLVHPPDDCHAIRVELEELLQDRFGIGHTTLQVDHDQGGRVRWVAQPGPEAAGRATGHPGAS